MDLQFSLIPLSVLLSCIFNVFVTGSSSLEPCWVSFPSSAWASPPSSILRVRPSRPLSRLRTKPSPPSTWGIFSRVQLQLCRSHGCYSTSRYSSFHGYYSTLFILIYLILLYSFIYSYIHPFMHIFIYLCTYSSLYAHIHPFMHIFIPSFINFYKLLYFFL